MSAIEDGDLLPEMMREAELVLAQQLHTMDELDDKSEQLLALGVAAMGAGIALFAFVVEKTPGGVPASFVVVWTAGLVLNAGGVFAFLLAYVGGHVAPSVGPSLPWLATKSEDGTWTAQEHFVNLLRAYPTYFASNATIIARGARLRRQGLFLLVMSVGVYAGAALYLLGRAMP